MRRIYVIELNYDSNEMMLKRMTMTMTRLLVDDDDGFTVVSLTQTRSVKTSAYIRI